MQSLVGRTIHVLQSLLIPIAWASSIPKECQASAVKLTTKQPLKENSIDAGNDKTSDICLAISLKISGGWGSLVRLKLLDALGEGMDHLYIRMVGL